jgi:SAM-dependent methyltransferase
VSDPYAVIAESYDLLVDWPARLARERSLLCTLVPPGGRILDVGCGTGHHTRLLAELGAQAVGIDPSAPMLARAQALTPGENPQFLLGGFAEIATLAGPFDGIVILGNSLAYVRDAAELTETLTACHAQLVPGGSLCAQVVNYDSLLDERDRWLPLLHRQAHDREYLFLREYRVLDPTRVEFTLLTLTRDGAWSHLVERSLHFPLTVARLTAGLQAAGFSDVHSYGDFACAPYAPAQSGSLIVVAKTGA